MSSTPNDQLERQIEETRRGLDATLHAIRERLSPRQQLKRTVAAARRGAQRSVHAGGAWAVNNPVTAVAVLAAVATLIYLNATRVHRQRGQ